MEFFLLSTRTHYSFSFISQMVKHFMKHAKHIYIKNFKGAHNAVESASVSMW